MQVQLLVLVLYTVQNRDDMAKPFCSGSVSITVVSGVKKQKS